MKLSEIKQILERTGFEVAYHHFNHKVEPPYIVYLIPFCRNFNADDKSFKKIKHFQVELYTSKKDEESEELIEEIFNDCDLIFDKSEIYIDNENLYQIIYELEEF